MSHLSESQRRTLRELERKTEIGMTEQELEQLTKDVKKVIADEQRAKEIWDTLETVGEPDPGRSTVKVKLDGSDS